MHTFDLLRFFQYNCSYQKIKKPTTRNLSESFLIWGVWIVLQL